MDDVGAGVAESGRDDYKRIGDALVGTVSCGKLWRMKFVDVKNDVAFRKIFGNEKKTKILISFLNAALQLEGHDQIVQVTILNPYQLPRIAGEKASIIDVRAVDQRGRNFFIEMQVAAVSGFDKRVQYYVSRDYSMQIDSGEDYLKLRPTIFIGILDFAYFETEDYLSYHLILDEKTLELRLKDMRFCFLELPKFQKEAHELTTPIEQWTYFLKNAETLAVIPDNVGDVGLLEAYNDADKHNWSKEDLITYDNYLIGVQDERGRIQFVEEQREAAVRDEVVRKAILRSALSDEEISDLVAVPLDLVIKIRAELKHP